jgi:NADH-quinone oxidoreductase subunit C
MDIRHPIPGNGGEWVTKFGEAWKRQVAELQKVFGDSIEQVRMPLDHPTDVPIVYVKRGKIVDVLKYVKESEGFQYGFLADITATDEGAEPRFEVVYQLFSHALLCRIRLKVRVPEGESVPSVSSVWEGANWAEREIFDMFGIHFSGHPDLRRILMDERWVGHPLRKDYPIRGYQIFTDSQLVDPERLK